jgi:hypothetical protein
MSQRDIRDHGIFGRRHCEVTASMGLPETGLTKCNFPDRWDMGGVIELKEVDCDRAKSLTSCHGKHRKVLL